MACLFVCKELYFLPHIMDCKRNYKSKLNIKISFPLNTQCGVLLLVNNRCSKKSSNQFFFTFED